MFRVVQDFLDSALDAKDEVVLCNAFSHAIDQVGYNHFAAGSALGFVEQRPGTVWIQRYPKNWAEYYLEREFWSVDPTLRLMPEYGDPFLWSDPSLAHRFTPAEEAFMEEAADAGVRGGVTIPIRGAFMFPGQVNIYSSEAEAAPHAIAKLHNLSVYFYDLARRLSMSDTAAQRQSLNAAERECLLWASLAKPDWEIAALTGEAEKSVRVCIKNAQRKLGVSTRVQAVVQAVLTEQITL